MKKCYKITGLDNGIKIQPVYVRCNIEDLDYYLVEIGDSCRYYEEISYKDYKAQKGGNQND